MVRLLSGILIVLLLLGVAACDLVRPSPKPTTIPTPTPNYEQKRADIVTYLRSVNKIDNDLNQVISYIQFPSPSGMLQSDDLRSLRDSHVKLLSAFKGALERVDSLTTTAPQYIRDSPLFDHFQEYKAELQIYLAASTRTARAIFEQNQDAIKQISKSKHTPPTMRLTWRDSIVSWLYVHDSDDYIRFVKMNYAFHVRTEKLMLTYNIPKAEVDYQPSEKPALSENEVIANVQTKGIPLLDKSPFDKIILVPQLYAGQAGYAEVRMWNAFYEGNGEWRVLAATSPTTYYGDETGKGLVLLEFGGKRYEGKIYEWESNLEITWYFYEKTGAVRLDRIERRQYPKTEPFRLLP